MKPVGLDGLGPGRAVTGVWVSLEVSRCSPKTGTFGYSQASAKRPRSGSCLEGPRVPEERQLSQVGLSQA